MSFDIKFTEQGIENACRHRKACQAIQHAFSKPSLVHLISKDWNLVFILSAYQVDLLQSSEYEGCSNMNASSFITFVTYMLRQNGIRFYKGLYVTFKLAPDLKQNPVDLSSYCPLNEGHFCILTNSMLRTYQ